MGRFDTPQIVVKRASSLGKKIPEKSGSRKRAAQQPTDFASIKLAEGLRLQQPPRKICIARK
jgi:hypothetical protein